MKSLQRMIYIHSFIRSNRKRSVKRFSEWIGFFFVCLFWGGSRGVFIQFFNHSTINMFIWIEKMLIFFFALHCKSWLSIMIIVTYQSIDRSIDKDDKKKSNQQQHAHFLSIKSKECWKNWIDFLVSGLKVFFQQIRNQLVIHTHTKKNNNLQHESLP